MSFTWSLDDFIVSGLKKHPFIWRWTLSLRLFITGSNLFSCAQKQIKVRFSQMCHGGEQEMKEYELVPPSDICRAECVSLLEAVETQHENSSTVLKKHRLCWRHQSESSSPYNQLWHHLKHSSSSSIPWVTGRGWGLQGDLNTTRCMKQDSTEDTKTPEHNTLH